jgi:ribosome maturation factor RimP
MAWAVPTPLASRSERSGEEVEVSVSEQVRGLVAPVVADLGLDLYDLEHAGGVLRVVVDRPGGVDLDTLALVTRLVSRELDHADPIPGRYTLEVSSPGLERALRTPAHFAAALGQDVAVRTIPGTDGERRVDGRLESADDEGVVVAGRTLRYEDIERARTVFTWGAAPKPSPSSGRGRRAPSASASREKEAS